MNAMRRITEVTGPNPGFHVRFYGKQHDAAWFPIKGVGSRAAVKAAKEWRDAKEVELGLSSAQYGSRRPRATYAGRDAGVFVTMGVKRDRFYADVMGVLNYTDGNKVKRKQKAVSILKNGYHAAYIAAYQARCEFTGQPLPAKVVVPKLTDEQVDVLIAHGATVKSLTERAIMPWNNKLA